MRTLSFLVAASAALAACQGATAFVLPSPSSGSGLVAPPRRLHNKQPAQHAAARIIRRGRAASAMAMVDPEAVSTAVTVAAAGAANASPFVAKIVNNLSSVAVLAVIIAVHELGHFLAGAWLSLCVC